MFNVESRRKKSWIAVALIVATFASLGNVGLKLAGAMRQVGTIASTKVDPRGAPAVAVARPGPPREPAAVTAPVAARAEPVPTTAVPLPAPAELEPVPLPGSGFEPETALRAAAEADPNVAELLDNADPAIGAAVRQFVYDMASPASSAGAR